MINQDNIEIAYHVLDECVEIIGKDEDMDYFSALVKACETIVQDDVRSGQSALTTVIAILKDIDFDKEEIRKAFQLQVLKGMRQNGISNENITPDTIGVFLAFLIGKFYPDAKSLAILDPLVGTANLLCTVANHLETNVTLIGVDNNQLYYRLARALVNMMDYNDDIYMQDTLTFTNLSADLIIIDFPYSNDQDSQYFPYLVLEHHEQNLKAGGYIFALVEDGFFRAEENRDFKGKILERYQAIGLIRLPDDIFRIQGKSILILQKKLATTTLNDDFLIAEIPSFGEKEAMINVIDRINEWFDKKIKRGQ